MGVGFGNELSDWIDGSAFEFGKVDNAVINLMVATVE